METIIYDETDKITEDMVDWMEDLLNVAAGKLNVTDKAEVSITVVTNDKIREINKEYRDKDQVTDVISFAIEDDEEDLFKEFDLDGITIPRDLGDIFISYDKAVEQATEFGHSVERELGFLMVHGFLHLNGYDHMTTEEEKIMFSLQEEILKEYGLKR
ncbi:rRNA maturation RNase YbeY [Alkalibacterium olivapovliticus]|uniref:Endoribonuclease YbeY n=1 Tax=Alkalibacterium olivapovliticus TaxID=99907 RepID=A0A2T0W998_9LACT|nr:rRNA maturation RNase YbeY [Alkalibacterium olivapovliticus]PRY83281.1 putative rRNA maturation factor [Alkalibacterium olivapovliticus]